MSEYVRGLPTVASCVGEIVELDYCRISFKKSMSEEKLLFKGHFPGVPIFPGVFVLDLIQAASEHYFETIIRPGLDIKQVALRLLRVNSIRYFSALAISDVLKGECNLKVDDNNLYVEGVCYKGEGIKVAAAKLLFSWGAHGA